MDNFLDIAIKIAYEVHKDETDKIGNPYILHPLHVMNSSELKTDIEKATAVLHDVLESNPKAEIMLKSVRMPEEVMCALKLLTRDQKDTYAQYIDKIAKSKNIVAIKVKLCDLAHNMSQDRMNNLDADKAQSLMARYEKAVGILKPLLESLNV